MTSTRPPRTTSATRPRLWMAGFLGVALLVAPTADLAQAATKTTAKATSKKTVAKKTVKTVKRPAPAKAAKKAKNLFQPNGRAPLAPVPFVNLPASKDAALPSAPDFATALAKVQPVNGLVTMLIVGTDARPNEKPESSRADSIHLFLYNPAMKKGTLVGFPRDSYVQSSTGERKITEVLSTAGPDELVKTVDSISGLPTKRYILTGFDGFTKMVDAVGGVNVLVKPAINDTVSAATFAEGWFAFNGKAALAYARARKSLPNGDFDRSLNQGKILIYSLARLREQTSELNSLTIWVNILRKYTVTNTAPGDWLYLAQVARNIDPASISSIVLPGSNDSVGGSDVVRLNDAKVKAIFTDLADGVLSTQSIQIAVPTPTVAPPVDAPVTTATTGATTTAAAASTTAAPTTSAP